MYLGFSLPMSPSCPGEVAVDYYGHIPNEFTQGNGVFILAACCYKFQENKKWWVTRESEERDWTFEALPHQWTFSFTAVTV